MVSDECVERQTFSRGEQMPSRAHFMYYRPFFLRRGHVTVWASVAEALKSHAIRRFLFRSLQFAHNSAAVSSAFWMLSFTGVLNTEIRIC